ncbi:MAG: RNA polymerase sigma factor RpoD, partial [Bacteroidetes bacterium]|nr:RNA polymerase sigma factor RpoD [Bacteroidota bacterium]
MAVKANHQNESETAAPEGAVDAPDSDAVQQTLKTLLRLGKERGFVTHDELNAALPAEDFTSEQIDDFMSTLSEMGVSVVEAAEG